jgi:hypothetical protein
MNEKKQISSFMNGPEESRNKEDKVEDKGGDNKRRGGGYEEDTQIRIKPRGTRRKAKTRNESGEGDAKEKKQSEDETGRETTSENLLCESISTIIIFTLLSKSHLGAL